MDEATRISLKDQFNSLLVQAIEGRRGGMALMRVLEELDFYNSPASAKHHLNVPGGLVMHSLNVARAALELCDKMPQFAKCNKGAVLTAALLHDVCKAGQYIKKPDGSYRYEDSHLMGHGEAYDNPLPLTWTRVEARDKETGEPNILCVTQRERAGQRRGVPLLAPVLPTMKQMGRYTDAELAAAIVASSITLFIKHDNPVSGAPFGEDPSDKAEDPNTPPDELAINLAPSAVFDLAPGETPDTFDPKHPTTTYDGFMSAMSNQVATGIEVPSEVLYKKFSSNYSASRGSLNEFWRTCDVMRDSFAADFCQPTYEKWFAEAVARGRIHAPGFFDDPAVAKAYMACNWNGPARTNLDAKKEIEAAILRMEQGISTAEQETAQMTGGSWRANMRQRKSEMEKMKEVGCNGQSQFPDEPQVNE